MMVLPEICTNQKLIKYVKYEILKANIPAMVAVSG